MEEKYYVPSNFLLSSLRDCWVINPDCSVEISKAAFKMYQWRSWAMARLDKCLPSTHEAQLLISSTLNKKKERNKGKMWHKPLNLLLRMVICLWSSGAALCGQTQPGIREILSYRQNRAVHQWPLAGAESRRAIRVVLVPHYLWLELGSLEHFISPSRIGDTCSLYLTDRA